MGRININPSDAWKYANVFHGAGDKWEAEVVTDSNGNVTDHTYSQSYLKQQRKQAKAETKKEKKVTSNKESCFKKLIKAPFKILWWIIKKVLIIVTFGALTGMFDENK